MLDYSEPPTATDNPKSIDDFWHTAVERPRHVLQRRESDLGDRRPGATRSPASRRGWRRARGGDLDLEPVSGDNFIYSRATTTGKWTGDVAGQGDRPGHRRDRPDRSGPPRPSSTRRRRTPATTGTSFCSVRGRRQLCELHLEHGHLRRRGNPPGTAGRPHCRRRQANFGTLNVSLLSQYPSMTDGTVDGRSSSRRRRSAQPGQLPARPARLRRLRDQRRDQAVPGPRARARRHRRSPADLRAGSRSPYGRRATRRSSPPTPAARRCSTSGQRRHAARLLSPATDSTARRQGSVGGHPEHGAAEALQARRRQLQGQPRLLRRRHAVGRRHVRQRPAAGRRSSSPA